MFGAGDGVIDQKLSRAKVHRTVRQAKPCGLEGSDGFAELFARRRPVCGHVENTLRLADTGRTDPNAPHAKPFARQLQPPPFFAQHLFGAEADIVEAQLECLVAAIADAFAALATVEAGHADIDQKGGDALAGAARGFVLTGCGEDDGEVWHAGT